jgi:hypothetical protein
MRQALHIFKKDIRHLWFEIAVAVFVVAAFTFTAARRAHWFQDPGTNRIGAWTLVILLLPLTWWTLIARVIQDEALPGDNQFWITRPYAWKSLLTAKTLFLLAFTSLPMLLADIIILYAHGLHPLGTEFPGLLWSQVLLAIVFILPIAALSALTSRFVQLVFAILTPCVIALGIAIVAPGEVIGGFLGPSDWVKSYYVFLIMVVAASAVLILQYATRRTTAARLLAIAAATLAVLGLALFPGSAAFKVQSWFSKKIFLDPVPQVQFDSGTKWLTRAVFEKTGRVRIELPLNIAALPPGISAKPEGFSLELRTSSGEELRVDQVPSRYTTNMDQKFLLQFTVEDAFYKKIKDEPLTIRGLLYLTLFGNHQSARIPFEDRSVTVPRVGACSASTAANRSYFLICTSAFRFPPLIVSYRFNQSTKDQTSDTSTSTQPRSISYSPFPAEVGINPVSQDFTFSTAPTPVSEALVDTIEPLAYIKRSFTIDNLRLADYEVQPSLPNASSPSVH